MSPETPPATLHIARTSARDIQIRDLYVRVDDRREFTLLFGERVELELEPGEHRIKITNRLFSKVARFDLTQGESARYVVANVPGGCWYAPLIILSGTGAYQVAIERADP